MVVSWNYFNQHWFGERETHLQLQVKPERWRWIKKTTESLTLALALALTLTLTLTLLEDQRASHARDVYTTRLFSNPSLKTLGASASVEPFIKYQAILWENLSWKLLKRVEVLQTSGMLALVTQCIWTTKIHLLIRKRNKQNCHSVLVLRFCWTRELLLHTMGLLIMFLLLLREEKTAMLFLNLAPINRHIPQGMST